MELPLKTMALEVSNGFKIKSNNAGHNTNNKNYMYFAFAQNPFQANGGLAR